MGCCEHGDERSGLIRHQAFLAQLKKMEAFHELLQLLCGNTNCHRSLSARHVRRNSQVCRAMAARHGALGTAVEVPACEGSR